MICVKLHLVSECSDRNLRTKIFSKKKKSKSMCMIYVKLHLTSKCSERNLRIKILSKIFKIYVYDMCEITSGVRVLR